MDRPIIFSAPMVRALLDGRKTMTRRLAWTGHCPDPYDTPLTLVESTLRPTSWQRVEPGDRLWVRERCLTIATGIYRGVRYIADGADAGDFDRARADGEFEVKSRPSIHMPRWASRLTLTVTEVKRERLTAISAEDCVAEGIDPTPHLCGCEVCAKTTTLCPASASGIILAFAELWQLLHGVESWGANPEVIALTFGVALRNIDAERVAA